mmetsp:Transcript_37787/g.50164  ORF Transcript_37787/g.50164 Transcript_37787/m.50164 type:complete len:91 (-) Transcript_37787:165-437(-)
MRIDCGLLADVKKRSLDSLPLFYVERRLFFSFQGSARYQHLTPVRLFQKINSSPYLIVLMRLLFAHRLAGSSLRYEGLYIFNEEPAECTR